MLFNVIGSADDDVMWMWNILHFHSILTIYCCMLFAYSSIANNNPCVPAFNNIGIDAGYVDLWIYYTVCI